MKKSKLTLLVLSTLTISSQVSASVNAKSGEDSVWGAGTKMAGIRFGDVKKRYTMLDLSDNAAKWTQQSSLYTNDKYCKDTIITVDGQKIAVVSENRPNTTLASFSQCIKTIKNPAGVNFIIDKFLEDKPFVVIDSYKVSTEGFERSFKSLSKEEIIL